MTGAELSPNGVEPNGVEDAPRPAPMSGRPWLTWAILAVVVGAFLLEVLFSLEGPKLDFSVPTLIAMGGLNRSLVFDGGQWYRLFTAPLLHANAIHILLNGVVLILVGRVLERLVGPLWFLALYVIGGLGGALMSLALNDPTLTSVGASGAIMGLCAAILVAAFHLPEGQARKRVLSLGARVLIPSLIPVATNGSGMQVDYGAHLGGALAGGAAAGLLLAVWGEERRLPPWKPAAATIAALGVLLSVAAGARAVVIYPAFAPLGRLIPESEMPHGTAEIEKRAAGLLARYPDDPRAHLQQAIALVMAQEALRAEKELRIGLALAEPHETYYWGWPLIESLRGLLALDLLDLDREAEAREVAARICRAYASPPAASMAQVIFDKHLCE